MKTILSAIPCALLASTLSASDLLPTDDVLLEFDTPQTEAKWKTVNDNVMGGRSKGGFRMDTERGVLVFSGSTNTNGGGFSSIRTQSQDWQMEDADGIALRFRGDGRTYQADLRRKGDRSWIPVAYRTDIPADPNNPDWQTVRIPFSAFSPSRMGRAVKGAPMAGSDVGAIGFMIYDKKDGPFKLEVDWIGIYRESDSDHSEPVNYGDMLPLAE